VQVTRKRNVLSTIPLENGPLLSQVRWLKLGKNSFPKLGTLVSLFREQITRKRTLRDGKLLFFLRIKWLHLLGSNQAPAAS